MQTSVSHMGTPPALRQFTIDTPLMRGSGQLPMTRLLGHALSNPKLAKFSPEQNHSKVMTRANNLSSLCAAMLLQLPPTKREQALIEIGGLNYAQQLLDFTERNPSKLDITDALRFSLALHFMVGILDHEGGKGGPMAAGYLKFARFFKDAQDRRAGRPEGYTASASGLNGLGQFRAPAATTALTRQVATPAPAPAPVAQQTNTAVQSTRAALVAATKAQADVVVVQPVAPIDWSKVGSTPAQQTPPQPTANIVSRDPSGACIRWSPRDPCYPAPPDRPQVVLSQVQADACGLMTAGGDIFASLETKQRNKLGGVARVFREVFGRAPNNSELQYYGSMQWCASMDPKDPMTALTTRMIWVREDIEAGRVTDTCPAPGVGRITEQDFEFRDAFSDIAKSLKHAADAAFDFLGKAADFIADVLCKGFKALFGPAVGGVICDIITFMTRMMVSGIAAIIDIVIESLRGTFEFIKLMIAGRVEDAFTALLRSMGNVLFSLSAPMMVPILMADKGQGRSMAQAFAELKVRAGRVMDREPLWPIMVIMSVVGVFSAVSGNVLGAITGCVVALAPMVATFISEPLKANIRELMAEKLVDIETGIIKFVKFVLLIFNGAMAIKDLIPKLRGQLAEFMKSKGAAGLTGGTDIGGAARVKYVLEKFSAGVNAISTAFRNFNVQDIVKSAGPLLALIPDLLLAILPDDAAKAMPSLTEWKDAVSESIKDTNKREATLRAGAKEIFESYSLGTKVQVIQEQVEAVPIDESAKIAAGIVGKAFKDKTNYQKFTATFRAELLKV